MTRWGWLLLPVLLASGCRRHPPAQAAADAGAASLPVAWTAQSASGQATIQQRGDPGRGCLLESSSGKQSWRAEVCAATPDQLTFVSEDGEWLLVFDPLPPVRDGHWEAADAVSLFHLGELRIRAPVGDLVRSSKDLHFFIGTVGWLRGTSDLPGSPPRYGPGGDTAAGEVADGSTFSLPFDDKPRPRPPPPVALPPPVTPATARVPAPRLPLPPPLPPPSPPPLRRGPQLAKELSRGLGAVEEDVKAGRLASAVEELERVRSTVRDDAGKMRELANYEGHLALYLLDVGNPDEARRFASIGVETDTEAPRPREALGKIAYAGNDLSAAMSEWNRGLAENPNDAALRSLVAKGQTESDNLKTYQTRSSDHFVLTFEGREERDVGDLALGILEEAYQKVPALYGFTPSDRVPVVLYPGDALQQVESKPKWAAGVFDGKVRTGSGGAANHPNLLRRVLAHEYGHAILHRALRGMSRAPGWFDEGMAQAAGALLEPEPVLTCAFGHPVQLQGLGGGFALLPGDNRQIHAAYLTARHAVEGLLARKGRGAMQDLIKRAGSGEPFPAAFEHAMGQPSPAFLEAFDQKDCAAQNWK